jgi:hypothetical protein
MMSESSRRPGPLDAPPRRLRRAKGEMTVYPNGAHAAATDDAARFDDAATSDVSTVAVDQAIATADEPRFRIFIIDTGWNLVAREVLQAHLSLFRDFMGSDPIYVLDRDMSLALLHRNRDLIGRDPIISVHDMRAIRHGHTGDVHGVRLHLGLMRDANKAKRALTMLVRFLARFRMSDDFEFQVRHRLRLEGVAGAITIIGGGTPHRMLLNE